MYKGDNNLFIRTYNDIIVNVNYIRSISIIGNRLIADMGEKNIVLYCNENKQALESAQEKLFQVLAQEQNSFDFSPAEEE